MQSLKDTKLLVIGFDSADFFLVKQYMEEGLLPTFSLLAERGFFSQLDSTTPYQSGPAWTTFATGVSPCKTGIYSFHLPPEHYEQKPVFSNDIPYPAFWEILGSMGFRCGVANIPMLSYPTRAFNGFVVSGYPSPDEGTSYPDNFHADIYENTSLKIPLPDGFELLSEYIKQTIYSDLRRASAAPELARNRPVDGLVIMFDMLDRVQHYYRHEYDRDHPAHNPDSPDAVKNIIPECYMLADRITLFLLNEFNAWDTCFIVSDHGSRPMAWRYNLFRFLMVNKLITLREQAYVDRSVSAGLKTLLPLLQQDRTIVYPVHETLSTAIGLDLNIRGRELTGVVPPGSADMLADSIIGQLKQERNPVTGETVFEEIYRREELCDAEYAHNSPDILALCNHKIISVPAFAEEVRQIMPPVHTQHRTSHQITGAHRREGIFFGAGKTVRGDFEITPSPAIVDIAPTVLAHCGVDKTPAMDGQRLPIFTGNTAAKSLKKPSAIITCDRAEDACAHEVTEQERQAAIDRLTGMGYI